MLCGLTRARNTAAIYITQQTGDGFVQTSVWQDITMSGFTIVSIDPGGTTGYAIGEITEANGFRFVVAGESRFSESGLFGMLESISPLYVVAESFEFRQSKHRIVLESRNLLGVCELWTTLRHRHYSSQSASTGKSYFTDDKLRKEGVYTVGSAHARDATRHLFHWMTFGQGYQFLEGK